MFPEQSKTQKQVTIFIVLIFSVSFISFGSLINFHEDSSPWRTLPDATVGTTITKNDKILSKDHAPVVIEEYKILFFAIPKVASTEFKRFFVRLKGLPQSVWCLKNIHPKKDNKLKTLDEYSEQQVQHMMTSPEWTRAIIVRHPKPRILSAYLDKFVDQPSRGNPRYLHLTCTRYKGNKQECLEGSKDFGFFVKNITTDSGTRHDPHWDTLYEAVDKKWWPWINFIGDIDTLSKDAKILLQKTKSSSDGVSAWDRLGKTGWSGNENDGECNGTGPFLEKKDKGRHSTNARDKMSKYYTPELERFVETRWKDDLENPFFRFKDLTLFEENKKE